MKKVAYEQDKLMEDEVRILHALFPKVEDYGRQYAYTDGQGFNSKAFIICGDYENNNNIPKSIPIVNRELTLKICGVWCDGNVHMAGIHEIVIKGANIERAKIDRVQLPSGAFKHIGAFNETYSDAQLSKRLSAGVLGIAIARLAESHGWDKPARAALERIKQRKEAAESKDRGR